MKKYLVVMGLAVLSGLVASENSEKTQTVRARTCDLGRRVRHARKVSVSQTRKSAGENSQLEDKQKENIQGSSIRNQESNGSLKIQEKVSTIVSVLNNFSGSTDEIVEELNV